DREKNGRWSRSEDRVGDRACSSLRSTEALDTWGDGRLFCGLCWRCRRRRLFSLWLLFLQLGCKSGRIRVVGSIDWRRGRARERSRGFLGLLVVFGAWALGHASDADAFMRGCSGRKSGEPYSISTNGERSASLFHFIRRPSAREQRNGKAKC